MVWGFSLAGSGAFAGEPPPGSSPANPKVWITGELKKWHTVTLTLEGPASDEQATPNPFRDYRLLVMFRHQRKEYVVPGFFAADGKAAETGATGGTCWQVRFTPDELGQWSYEVSFRTGPDLAVSFDPSLGTPCMGDGLRGTFSVGPSDKTPPDFRAQGRLRYVGEHYLRFAESGRPFLKAGADSPENFLAYVDFDGTRSLAAANGPPREGEARPRGLHTYEPHLRDWRPGDPEWRGGKGRGIIGALNYLASERVNSVYFLTMNVGGDGRDVWPWISPEVPDRFDISKLDQWEIVFSHMDRLGIMLHVVTQETENDQWLDGGELGVMRKLYYRELIARFSHHLAVVWNLGEENTNTDNQRREFAEYIRQADPYDHPIVIHTFPGKQEEVYRPLLGFAALEGVSLQTNDSYAQTRRWVEESRRGGRPWVVTLDEIGPADVGVKPDADDFWHDEIRKKHLWPVLMAGGAGVEWYFGYHFPHNDLDCEDWRSRDHLWDLTRHAVDFFEAHLPFTNMRAANELLRVDGQKEPASCCFALPGEVYAIYRPRRESLRLQLPERSDRFEVFWYNPRTGGPLQRGSVRILESPGQPHLGDPPSEPDQDWTILVRRLNRG